MRVEGEFEAMCRRSEFANYASVHGERAWRLWHYSEVSGTPATLSYAGNATVC